MMNCQHPRLSAHSHRACILTRSCVRGVMSCVMACVLGACQTERVTTSDGWQMPPEPRAAPATPANARADRMAFLVGSKPDDTDNNGYPDTIRASVALFNSEHPTALRQDGAFVFLLYEQGRTASPNAQPIAQWRMEGDALRSTYAMAQYGPCYQFSLSLLETPTGDRLRADRADVVCRFEPADGSAPVVSTGVRTVQIGGR